ncbi:MAG: hypothetical protein CXZ00_02975 [Acidobacteria bacterium]|nr:MAG: hypothetical protein CXZ00_02975 [Acidobacteriota bacterium]
MLALKMSRLSTIRSTIPLDAGVQTTHSRAIQVDSVQPLPAYPAAGAAPVVILHYQVPASMSGALTLLCIAHLGAAGTFSDGSGVVVWRVLINGVPQKGLENIYVQIGSPNQLASMFLLLKENDLVQITAQIPAGKVAPAGNPFARIAGYLDYGGLGSRAPISGGKSSASSGDTSSASSSGTPSVASSSSLSTMMANATASWQAAVAANRAKWGI